jgi:Predicted metal-binding integral membrane protein (DUF2182)
MALESAPPRAVRAARRVLDFAGWHPEWWIVTLSAAAWLLVVLSANSSFVPEICFSVSLNPVKCSLLRLSVWPIRSQLGADYTNWLLMTIAVMLPLVIMPARHVAFRSFSWRRDRAMAGFLLGYIFVWALAGAALVPILVCARLLDPSGGRLAMMTALVCAAAWQLTPWKLRALRGCHRMVAVSGTGWRADTDCIRFGMETGGNCAASCWLLMLTSAIGAHGLLAMLCVQMIALRERYASLSHAQPLDPIALIPVAMLLQWQL